MLVEGGRVRYRARGWIAALAPAVWRARRGGKLALAGGRRSKDAGSVCEVEVGLGYRCRVHWGELAVSGVNSQAASKRRWREGFPECQRWSLAPIVRTGSPNLRHCHLQQATRGSGGNCTLKRGLTRPPLPSLDI